MLETEVGGSETINKDGDKTGGEAGIRTLGRTLKALQRFSKPPPSASRPPHRAKDQYRSIIETAGPPPGSAPERFSPAFSGPTWPWPSAGPSSRPRRAGASGR